MRRRGVLANDNHFSRRQTVGLLCAYRLRTQTRSPCISTNGIRCVQHFPDSEISLCFSPTGLPFTPRQQQSKFWLRFVVEHRNVF